MDKICIDNLDMVELDRLIDSAIVDLERNNLEYRNLRNRVRSILKKYKNVSKIIDDDEVENLNKEECKMLQIILQLRIEIEILEDREIYFLGGKQVYYYFKKLQLLD